MLKPMSPLEKTKDIKKDLCAKDHQKVDKATCRCHKIVKDPLCISDRLCISI